MAIPSPGRSRDVRCWCTRGKREARWEWTRVVCHMSPFYEGGKSHVLRSCDQRVWGLWQKGGCLNLRGQLWARCEQTNCVKSKVQGRRGMGSYWGECRGGASSLSWRDLKRAWATAWGMDWRVLSRSTAWDTVPGAGLRPVHLHPPGICIWEKKGEISGVEASGEKCPWQPASSWRGPCFA